MVLLSDIRRQLCVCVCRCVTSVDLLFFPLPLCCESRASTLLLCLVCIYALHVGIFQGAYVVVRITLGIGPLD